MKRPSGSAPRRSGVLFCLLLFLSAPGEGAVFNGAKWPSLQIAWRIDVGSVPPEVPAFKVERWQRKIHEAIDQWNARTVADLQEVGDGYSNDHIVFVCTTGPSSSGVGYKVGGPNAIRLRLGASVNAIVHEIGHRLGMLHEQDRPDLQKWRFAENNAGGVMRDCKNCRTVGPCDPRSVMHYSSAQESKNRYVTYLTQESWQVASNSQNFKTCRRVPGENARIERLRDALVGNFNSSAADELLFHDGTYYRTATVQAQSSVEVDCSSPEILTVRHSAGSSISETKVGRFETIDDGLDDLIYADGGSWFIMRSRGGYVREPLGSGGSLANVFVGDVDGDDVSDLIAPDRHAGEIRVKFSGRGPWLQLNQDFARQGIQGVFHERVLVGDFVGQDERDDILAWRSSGSLGDAVWVSSGGSGPWQLYIPDFPEGPKRKEEWFRTQVVSESGQELVVSLDSSGRYRKWEPEALKWRSLGNAPELSADPDFYLFGDFTGDGNSSDIIINGYADGIGLYRNGISPGDALFLAQYYGIDPAERGKGKGKLPVKAKE